MTRIALLGEYDPSFPPHQATIAACGHSATALGVDIAPQWVSTADVTDEFVNDELAHGRMPRVRV